MTYTPRNYNTVKMYSVHCDVQRKGKEINEEKERDTKTRRERGGQRGRKRGINREREREK